MLVTRAVVLSRRPRGEYDRAAVLYTRSFGRLHARFIGVDRPRGKLKALSEPLVRAEYRIYLKPGAPRATVAGGRLESSHPRLRTDLERTLLGLEMCELLDRLTPEASPSPAKFDLIAGHLDALEERPSPWLGLSFALRLLDLAGLGPQRPFLREVELRVWEALRLAPVEELRSLPHEPPLLARLEAWTEQALEAQLERPLRCRALRRSLQEAPPEPAAA